MKSNEAYFLGALGDAYLDFKRNEVQIYQKDDREYFVAGLFDSEGSVYLSTKNKKFLNGPYKHWNSKMKSYHLRVYGKHARLFFLRIPIIHKEKKARFEKFLREMQTPKL